MKNRLPFGFDKPEDSPGFLLWQTTLLWQRSIKKIVEKEGLSHAQFVLMATTLWFSEHNYQTTQGALVDWTKLDKMTVSKSLKKLSILGYVERLEDVHDARAKQVFLTKNGRKLVNLLVPLVEAADADFFGSSLGSTQEKDFIKILSKLVMIQEQKKL